MAYLAIFTGVYFVQSFTSEYGLKDGTGICEAYQETSDFEQHFVKYLERVAAYARLRDEGFEPSETFSLVRGHALLGNDYKAYPTDSELAQLEFYNRKLNTADTSFLYYVKGETAETTYVSPQLQKAARNSGKTYLEYITESIDAGAPYFVLNDTGIYSTNLETYGYLTTSVQEYLMENSSFTTLYAISTVDFEGTIDDFTPGYKSFTQSFSRYESGRRISVIGAVLFILFFVAAVFLAGYVDGYRPIEGVTTPAELRAAKRAQIDLRGYDKIPLELAFLINLAIYGLTNGLLPALLFRNFGSLLMFNGQVQYLLYFLVDLGVSYAIFMPFIFSAVRRYKAGTLVTNTAVVRFGKLIVHWVKRFFENRNITLIAGVILGIYLVGGIAACILCFLGGIDPIFLIVGIVLYLVVFFFLTLQVLRTCADLNVVVQETERIQNGSFDQKIPDTLKSAPVRTLGGYINNISEGLQSAVDEQVKSERLKTELITNVSHDIKTPLTSIINYVDLLKRMDLDNEKANGYLNILENKSQRLKTLIEDLVEASKASSGAIQLQMERINFIELIRQSCAEYEEKFEERQLQMIKDLPDHSVYIYADGRRTFRIVDNLLSNAAKYAMKGTRVYVDVTESDETVTLTVKNISASQLNINADELMERFVRGDQSRSTEGSGLGLSIAESLAKLQNAEFKLEIEGDLFKAVLAFEKM